MKNRVLCIVLLLTAVLFSACSREGDISNARIERGTSVLYTEEDIDSALNVILEEFKGFEGCILHTVRYEGDLKSMANLDYCNYINEEADYVQSICFVSTFHTPKHSDDSWELDTEYEYSWYLAREKDGEWCLVTYGMG